MDKPSRKNFILDTTVLFYDAQALFKFEDNNVYIPITVIEDIDHFKKDLSETGRNARQTARYLDALRLKASVAKGIPLDNGGTLYVRTGSAAMLQRMPESLREKERGNKILALALDVKQHAQGKPTIFVSKDLNLRIKADALGLDVEDYESDKVDIEELYSGYRELTVEPSVIQTLRDRGSVAFDERLLPNQYVKLETAGEGALCALARFDADKKALVRLISENVREPWRVVPHNREQFFAFDALLNDAIQLVTLVGKAGTGKTLLAIAASLFKTVDENVYNRVLVSRPTLPMGKDIGFLPGTVEEKLTPWMYPIADNVELIMRNDGRNRGHTRGFRELVDMGILVIEPLTYIRGRSIHQQFVIIDEAQNLTPHEIKTIITRVGDASKIVVTGDPYQIDNPYVDSSSNGLTYLVERFKEQPIAAHITMTKGERSKLSELAANLL
jgi:PhoH-like ATPase